MRFKPLALSIAAVVFLASATGVASSHTEKGKAKPKAAGKVVLTATEEMKWADVEGMPVKVAVVKGDAKKGPHEAFHKFPAGFAAPLHFHTADHDVVVVSGNVTLTPEGQEAKKLGPGSWFRFTGKMKHMTACDAGADCVLFVTDSGPWDVVMADAKK